jgi:uncharacterized membrane protein
MARRLGWLWAALVVLGGIGYQCLVHSAIRGGQIGSIRIALAFLPLLVVGWWVAARARNKLRWTVILLAAGMAIYVLAHYESWGLTAAYGIPHAAIYAFLLWQFGGTLRHGNEPLVTRLARRVHGALPPAMAAYTRRVTIAWCVFFAAQLALSMLLFGFAALNTWSLFINVLNFPLLASMFIGEYAYRKIRHRNFLRASFFDAIRAFANDAARPTGANGTGART